MSAATRREYVARVSFDENGAPYNADGGEFVDADDATLLESAVEAAEGMREAMTCDKWTSMLVTANRAATLKCDCDSCVKARDFDETMAALRSR